MSLQDLQSGFDRIESTCRVGKGAFLRAVLPTLDGRFNATGTRSEAGEAAKKTRSYA